MRCLVVRPVTVLQEKELNIEPALISSVFQTEIPLYSLRQLYVPAG